MADPIGVHLVQGPDRATPNDALAARLGGRVGVRAVLDDLNRDARVARVPGRAPRWGFTFDTRDDRTRLWWPQGVTTTADAAAPETVEGRSVVVTSWYSRDLAKVNTGSRLSFVEITDRSRLRYRHVLLVEAVLGSNGRVRVRPVRVHAGGIVWHGPYLHVAATEQGLCTFRLDDILHAPDADRFGGYRYLVPLFFWYDAVTGAGVVPMRYSFLSLDRSAAAPALMAGEYGRGKMTTRLVRYPIDPATSLLCRDAAGICRPALLEDAGVRGMQGAVAVDGTCYLTTSFGVHRLGSLWAGRPGSWVEHAKATPTGPEDLAYWPSRDELWSLSEHPRSRFVFAMARPDGGSGA